MDERDNYGYGYAPVGERFYDLKSGRRQGRINTALPAVMEYS
jgi:hypothetical protein